MDGKVDAAAKVATENQQRIEQLTQTASQLEKEKSAIAAQNEHAATLAKDRLKRINELQRQIENSQADEADLAARQRLMQEEMVRAEAQLDLIKDLLLRGPGL
jgi:peptidoglycan hydrolase CwlO-like protein